MFAKCPKLTSLNISGWDVSNVTTVLEMFKGSPNVQIEGMDDLDFSHANGVNKMY
jgi:surface protein